MQIDHALETQILPFVSLKQDQLECRDNISTLTDLIMRGDPGVQFSWLEEYRQQDAELTQKINQLGMTPEIMRMHLEYCVARYAYECSMGRFYSHYRDWLDYYNDDLQLSDEEKFDLIIRYFSFEILERYYQEYPPN